MDKIVFSCYSFLGNRSIHMRRLGRRLGVERHLQCLWAPVFLAIKGENISPRTSDRVGEHLAVRSDNRRTSAPAKWFSLGFLLIFIDTHPFAQHKTRRRKAVALRRLLQEQVDQCQDDFLVAALAGQQIDEKADQQRVAADVELAQQIV